MRVVFHPAAAEELERGVEYYEACDTGLGMAFFREVCATVERIRQFPEAWAPLSRNTRRCRTSRFPCGVIYQTTPDTIRIIAVADLRREPGYWRKRT